jgi:heterodisulfide reductase subunit B
VKAVSYYPGCSLHGAAREYGASTVAVCQALDVDLQELDDWTCCGASSGHSLNHTLGLALAARNLTLAEATGHELVAPCAACYHRLKVAKKESASPVTVLHLLDLLADDETLDRIRDSAQRPLEGLKAVCYYGCLLVRPPDVTGVADHEDPQSMDRVMAVIGAEVRPWSFKTDCCGGGITAARPAVARRLSSRLAAMAQEAGADCIVTACPMCQTNLDTSQQEGEAVPVLYFTELLAHAMGLEKTEAWWPRHMVDPTPILARAGIA